MKKSILVAAIAGAALSTPALSKFECGVVIDYPAGGTSDRYARLMQKNNPDLKIEYRIGGMGSNAINFIATDRTYYYFGSPVMFGANSPIKNPPIELVRILVGAPILALSNPNKQITWDKVLKGKISIGHPGIGTSHHILGLQLQAHNPDIVLVPAGGDNKAFPLIMNGDLDIYFISATTGNLWIKDFKLDNLFTISFNKPLKINDKVTLVSQGFNGAFIHKDASPEERAKLMECLDKAVSPPAFADALRLAGAEFIDMSGEAKDKAFTAFLDLMRKYGL